MSHVVCDCCEEFFLLDTMKRCLECSSCYCDDCDRFHTKFYPTHFSQDASLSYQYPSPPPLLRDRVVDFDSLSPEDQRIILADEIEVSYCPDHTTYRKHMWCFDCEKRVCTMCCYRTEGHFLHSSEIYSKVTSKFIPKNSN